MPPCTPISLRNHIKNTLRNALDDAIDKCSQRYGHDVTTVALKSLVDELFFDEVDEDTAELILAMIEEG